MPVCSKSRFNSILEGLSVVVYGHTESISIGDMCAWEDVQHIFHRYQTLSSTVCLL